MAEVRVGKWGKSLAVRVPLDVARAIGLSDGEPVEIEAADGEIRIRRSADRAAARRAAEQAIADIRAQSKKYSLGGITIRELIEEGRR